MKSFRALLGFGVMLAVAPSARACTTCFADPTSDVGQAMSMAILFMLGILVVVLGLFTAFFLYLRKRASMPTPDYLELAEASLAENR